MGPTRDQPAEVTPTSSDDSAQVIPQRTVDNNLGPDRLVGPMVLDSNYNTLVCSTMFLDHTEKRCA